jgi:hypothetical protein
MFSGKSKQLVELLLNGKQIAFVSDEQLPAEKKISFRLPNETSVLSFRDAAGLTYDHRLSFEKGWIHISVRVHPNLACQADCLVSESEKVGETDFQKGLASGIRFQPFFLPGCKANAAELVGRGLFYRGFHFSGTITPGNVSLSCICDSCRKNFRLQSFHAGFGICGYFYSDSGLFTLIVDGNVEGCPPAMGDVDSEALARLETRLPKSTRDGTAFRYFNSLRCPHCKAAYIDFQKFPKEREIEYYGNYFYSEEPDRFKG